MIKLHNNTTPLGEIRKQFETVRKNALINPITYDFRFCQKNRKDAYIEFLENILKVEGYKLFKKGTQK